MERQKKKKKTESQHNSNGKEEKVGGLILLSLIIYRKATIRQCGIGKGIGKQISGMNREPRSGST